MRPVPEWRRVLMRAWSVRLALASGLCSAVSTLLYAIPSVGHPIAIPVAAFGFAVAAVIARIVDQKNLKEAP